jgi:hypothetical protein
MGEVKLLALLALGLGGCTCRGESQPRQAAAGERATPAPDRAAPPERAAVAVDRDRPAPDQPELRRLRGMHSFVGKPIPLDEAVALMPALPSAELLAEPTPTAKGQVRFHYCVTAAGPAEAADAVAGALRGAGWEDVIVEAPGDDATPRHAIAAKKGDDRLAIAVQAVKRDGCEASVGRYYTTVTMARTRGLKRPGR